MHRVQRGRRHPDEVADERGDHDERRDGVESSRKLLNHHDPPVARCDVDGRRCAVVWMVVEGKGFVSDHLISAAILAYATVQSAAKRGSRGDMGRQE